MQTVYIDILMIVNLVMDYLVVRTIAAIWHVRYKLFRLILSAVMGAVFSLAIFLPESGFISFVVRVTSAGLIVLTAFGFNCTTAFLKLFLTFLAVSALLAGMLLAVRIIFKPGGMEMSNGIIYFNISPLVLLGTAAACCVFLTLMRRFVRGGAKCDDICEITVTYGINTVRMKALIDSGHDLHDVFDDLPVIVISSARAEHLFSSETFCTFKSAGKHIPPESINSFRLIPYSVIGGHGLLPAFRPDTVEISYSGQSFVAPDCMIAVCSDEIEGEYSAITGKDILELSVIPVKKMRCMK